MPPELATFDDYVRGYASSVPRRVALFNDDLTITYGELPERVDRYARALLYLGASRGDVVGVYGWSRPECFIAFLAICRIGAVYLGLNPKHTAGELEYVLRDSGCRAILFFCNPEETDQHEKLRALAAAVPGIRAVVTQDVEVQGVSRSLASVLSAAQSLANGAVEAAAAMASPDRPSAIVYTSGSTGSPKGALLSQACMIRSALISWQHWYGAVDPLRTIVHHPINHVGWLVCECVTALMPGGTMYFRERFNGAATLRAIERHRLNLWLAFPSMIMLALEDPEGDRYDLSSLEHVAVGSMPNFDVLTRLKERTRARLTVSYGLTEASGGALMVQTDQDFETAAGVIGPALPGVEARIADEQGRSLPNGSPGEILIRDRSVFLGYFDRPEATAVTLDPAGWLRTGDAATMDDDGVFRIVGRMKEMFKSGGYNVYPTEIETVLCAHESISAAAVVQVPDRLWGEVGMAFLVPREGMQVDVETVRLYVRERLANYKVPKHFQVRDRLPQLPNGKYDKVSLRAEARDMAGRHDEPMLEALG